MGGVGVSFCCALGQGSTPSAVVLNSQTLYAVGGLRKRLRGGDDRSEFLSRLVVQVRARRPVRLSSHGPAFSSFLTAKDTRADHTNYGRDRNIFMHTRSATYFRVRRKASDFARRYSVFRDYAAY